MTFKDLDSRDRILLESAKRNLHEMAYFGICEYQKMSQYLFESAFGLHFLHPFIQLNETHSSLYIADLRPETLHRIQQLNYLDVELYDYAKQLFARRFEKMKRLDTNFVYNYNHLGRLYGNISGPPATGSIQDLPPEMRIMRKVQKLKKEKLGQLNSSSYVSSI